MVMSKLIAVLIAAVLSSLLWAADTQMQDKAPLKEQAKTKTMEREQIFGSQLMTAKERRAHRNKMRAAKTLEEREKIRLEHHDEMVKRAKEKGMTLPEEPPMRGGGMGPGMGAGGGMGPGGGMDKNR
jgi:hypothetical protein